MTDNDAWYPGKYLFGNRSSKSLNDISSEVIKEGYLEKQVNKYDYLEIVNFNNFKYNNV